MRKNRRVTQVRLVNSRDGRAHVDATPTPERGNVRLRRDGSESWALVDGETFLSATPESFVEVRE